MSSWYLSGIITLPLISLLSIAPDVLVIALYSAPGLFLLMSNH